MPWILRIRFPEGKNFRFDISGPQQGEEKIKEIMQNGYWDKRSMIKKYYPGTALIRAEIDEIGPKKLGRVHRH